MRRLALLLTVLCAAPAVAGPRDELWKQVAEAIEAGQPKTAIERLEPILAGAFRDKAYPEAVKAIGRRISLEAEIQGGQPEEKIVRLKAEIAKAPPEMLPVLQAILANWCWEYFEQNNWRFLERTATAQPPGDDLATCDLPRLFAEIDRQFDTALAAEDRLQAIPIADYDNLLDKGDVPDAYRPTLFDFLVHEALAFYSAGEQAGATAEDAFELAADSPIFAPTDEFLRWQLPATDQRSPTLKALRLYQRLLKFHRDDQDATAFLDADVWRLQFGDNLAFGDDKHDRYRVALKKFVDKWGDHEVSARARFVWASSLHADNQWVAARDVARPAINAFPKSPGGRLCAELVQQIEDKSSSISVERVWNEPWPEIRVAYRNVTRVHFRLVPYALEERLTGIEGRLDHLDEREQQALLTRKASHQWSADLPPTADYRERTANVPVPVGVKPGSYFLIASHDPEFDLDDNQVAFTDVWVSRLAIVNRQPNGDGIAAGFVLNAETGEPLAAAQVRSWLFQADQTYRRGPVARTDEHGMFSFGVGDNVNYVLDVRWEDQELATTNGHSGRHSPRHDNEFQQTVFFTDRALYRPGQTIQYKGLCISANHERDVYQTLAGQTFYVAFSDANGQEIARQEHRTNDYGSFSGSFTAPRDRLAGQMSLHVVAGPTGRTSVHVEEYKRPKFLVQLESPQTAAKLNAEVTLTGKATAYTGAAVNGAAVRYRVSRHVGYPNWRGLMGGWRMPQSLDQEIAHGVTRTAADGTFRIVFAARPDPKIPEQEEPVFQFEVSADVTDGTGETRSDERTVSVGYTALEALLTADDWQTVAQPVRVAVHTMTLDQTGQRAEGALKIHRLKAPPRVHRATLGFQEPLFTSNPPNPLPADFSDPNSWPLGEVVAEQRVATDAEGRATASFSLPVGAYRGLFETQDRFGKRVTAQMPLKVLEPDAKRYAIAVPSNLMSPSWTVEPGGEFQAVWGTGYETGRAFIEVEQRGKLLQSFWTEPGRTQVSIRQAVDQTLRGGFTIRATMVRENRAYLHSHRVTVPWSNKNLAIKWEHFTSKLQPGQKQTWTAVITGPDSQPAVAEMVASLFDASLDAYLPHNWPRGLGVFRQNNSNIYQRFENMDMLLRDIGSGAAPSLDEPQLKYRSFPPDFNGPKPNDGVWSHCQGMGGGMGGMGGGMGGGMALPGPQRPLVTSVIPAFEEAGGGVRADAPARGPAPDLSKVAARANLNETAFFFPHLLSDKNGVVKLQFTMPEAVTEWRFLGFAHDRELRAGLLEGRIVTAKELMVQPNPPRFLREGDVLEFTVKVSNQSAARQTGSVQLTLADARTGVGVDTLLQNAPVDRDFDVPAGESRSYAWRLTVPDDVGFLTYKAVGSTGRLSDGEEGFLPVLPRRVLVTESLPLPIRGPQAKEFDFAKLRQSGASDTLRQQSLTVQMTSHPAWYAVLALPYLMEFPYECSEQTFNRLYANALARHIAQADPKIRRVFEQWRGTPALDSPLLKNQDMKTVLAEETPWWRQAQAESQSRRNVAVLFDDNRLNDETERGLRKLTEQQRSDGAWPWFPGGPANDYITLYIATGFGRLRHLGVDVDVSPALKAWKWLDAWIDQQYRDILKKGRKHDSHLSSTIALYLYGRSFFLNDTPLDDAPREAVDYFLGQARQHWLKVGSRQSQGHLAIALKRFGDQATPAVILRSLREHAVTNEEFGMFWRDTERSWWWYHAPIETQALMIEAFDEVLGDAAAVEDCKVWLLKQKQTQDWKTTKATADAVYALLLRGADLLASDSLVQVSLGGRAVKPEQAEAGTGFFERRFAAAAVTPDLGRIRVKKTDPGAAWGSVHWQYFEDLAKITPYEGTPLTLKKRLFTRQHTATGPVLEAVTGPVEVGDELVVRIELRADRDLEYVHLKDHRGSGTEPTNVLSSYRFQDGLAYYESTRDTSSHFFIDYLPKGTYVFEYATRVVHQGRYQTGLAQIQCLYAPEFNSHSESLPLVVR